MHIYFYSQRYNNFWFFFFLLGHLIKTQGLPALQPPATLRSEMPDMGSFLAKKKGHILLVP